MALRWGIAAAGNISHDFVTAVQTCSENDHKVVAVAARSLDKAQKFAKDHNIVKAYEGYQKLGEDKDIDIVYIANLNHVHFEVSKLILEFGKHVLCEKPLTISENQTRKLIEIARKKGVFFMEAVWSRCFPAYRDLRRLIDSGDLGDVLFVAVNFGQNLQHIDWLQDSETGGGSMLNLGIYMLQFQQYVFRGLRPIRIAVNGHLNKQNADESIAAVTTYPDGKMAVVSTSIRVAMPNEGVIVGTKGTIRIPDFWCPTQLITNNKTYEYELPKTSVPFICHNSAGLAFEAEEVRKCIKAGKTEYEEMPHHETIELAQLMDLMRKEIGVALPQETY